jgi:hypothetical protein
LFDWSIYLSVLHKIGRSNMMERLPDTTLLSFASVLSDRELQALIEKLLIKSVM